ncbi:hypothetical protein PWT90_04564 [Aphanocladium album]|nr:hypothetical protein PWT90_04564 [Aphanocladium album]
MTANSSRRRVDSEPTGSDGQNPAHKGQTAYEKLLAPGLSTRFLTIKSASASEERISCEVCEVPFGDKIRFEALSYRWGKEQATESILVNGVETRIQQNLLDALRHLRSNHVEEGGKRYWIDALCINQKDKDERNAQVKIMGKIYFRASVVIIWLGKEYEKYGKELPQLQQLGREAGTASAAMAQATVPGDAEVAEGTTNSSTPGLNLAKALYHDKYWNRVWIVQEAGLAGRLIVCFGNCITSWDNFIHLLTMHNVGSEGPLKLHNLRRRQYEGSRKFLQLLRDYKNAACQESRDKVYGLVGLASDVQFFPIDYRKSLFEVWKDVMVFANGFGMLDENEIISVGGLVKYLLMGTECEPLDQMLRSYVSKHDTSALTDNSEPPAAFRIPAKVLGCVTDISFRPDEIVSDPSKQERWEQMVQVRYPDDAESAHAESDRLLRTILTPGGPDPTTACYSYSSAVQWTEARFPYEQYSGWPGIGQLINKLQASSRERSNEDGSKEHQGLLTKRAQLYQLKSIRGRIDWKMGIASGQVQLGDLICWVASSRMAIILRPQINGDQWTFHAVGTAFVTKDLVGISVEAHRQRYEKLTQQARASTVNLDATFVFILLDDKSWRGCS